MDIDYEILKFSNMNRDIHIGHLLERDREGTGYCSLLALSKQEDTEAIIKNKLKVFQRGSNNKAAWQFICPYILHMYGLNEILDKYIWCIYST